MSASSDIWQALDTLADTDPVSTEDDLDRHGTSLDLMERISNRAGGLERLVRRYGACQKPVILRPLSFILARAVDRVQEPNLGTWIIDIAVNLRCSDVTTQVNLLTALHRLAIAESLLSPDTAPPQGLLSFIARGLHSDSIVQSAASGVLIRLYEDEMLGCFSDEELRHLHDDLNRVLPGDDEMLQLDLNTLLAFFPN